LIFKKLKSYNRFMNNRPAPFAAQDPLQEQNPYFTAEELALLTDIDSVLSLTNKKAFI